MIAMRITKVQLFGFIAFLFFGGLLKAQIIGGAFYVSGSNATLQLPKDKFPGLTVQSVGINKFLVCTYTNDETAVYNTLLAAPGVQYISKFTIKGKKIAAETGRIIIKLNSAANQAEIQKLCADLGLDNFKKLPLLTNTFTAQNKLGGLTNIEACKAVLSSGLCQYVEPEMAFSPIVPSTPNDALFNRQWSLLNTGSAQQYNGTVGADMKVTEAWNITQGNPAINVAIIDAGVDTLHPDLMPNLLRGYDAANDSDITHGYPTPNYDEDGHGTCCAGIACAVSNNSIGTAGVAPGCKIIPIRLFYYLDFGGTIVPFSTTVYAANAIGWAWQNKADVLSNSWGVPDSLIPLFGDPQIVYDVILDASTQGRYGKGCVQLFSSGNDDSSYALLPGRLPEVISVGASSMCDERKSPTSCDGEAWWGGNYGDSLDISAPGVKIPAPDMLGIKGFTNGSYYNVFNGTSAACPNAAGVVALILSVNPTLTGTQARYILESTADRTGGYTYDQTKASGTWNYEMGYGRVNALSAVQATVGVKETMPQNFSANIYYDNNGNPLLNLKAEKPVSVTVAIYDVTGRFLQNAYSGTSSQLSNQALNITTPGMYLVRVTAGTETLGIKVVVR